MNESMRDQSESVNFDETRQLLEIEKLKNDQLYAKRNFVLQVINTIGVVVVAAVVFVYFQSPSLQTSQVIHLEKELARIAELSPLRRQVEESRSLAERWPGYVFVSRAAGDYARLEQAQLERTRQCEALDKQIAGLQQSHDLLKTKFAQRRPKMFWALRPEAKALKTQMSETQSSIARARTDRVPLCA